ncbi:hypothetical protein CTAYLR_000987 [Chrysophaeum taylorii]|uniref:Polycomb protein VEFS-Box domain-containing protein n=1 Tax=Chrysophaeum taylorii TaxID=2483200 RepID=A0AAD7XQ18_9STRA|nr:hypothetical protein CTAYLR_000987 [Chrysophaeum taylorii]
MQSDGAFQAAHAPAAVWARHLAERHKANPLYLPKTLSYRRARPVPRRALGVGLELLVAENLGVDDKVGGKRRRTEKTPAVLCATLYRVIDHKSFLPLEALVPVTVTISDDNDEEEEEEEEESTRSSSACKVVVDKQQLAKALRFKTDVSKALEAKDDDLRICLQVFETGESFDAAWPSATTLAATPLDSETVRDCWPVAQHASTGPLRAASHALLVPVTAFAEPNLDASNPAARGGALRLRLEPRKSDSSGLALRAGAALVVAPADPPAPAEAPSHPTVHFHLLYQPKKGELSSRVETKTNGRCLWCDEYCGPDPRGLLAHVDAHHTPSLSFQCLADPKGHVHILALPRQLQDDDDEVGRDDDVENDFIFVGPPPPLPEIPEARGTDEASMRVASQLAARSPPKLYVPPPRQYYHSRTGAPIHPRLLATDYDSDDDVDETWRLELSDRLLDEFEDVTSPEKDFMKLWNAYVFNNPVRADRVVPAACLAFARTRGPAILKANLRHNFLLHLFHLWDNSLLAATHISDCLKALDDDDDDKREHDAAVRDRRRRRLFQEEEEEEEGPGEPGITRLINCNSPPQAAD